MSKFRIKSKTIYYRYIFLSLTAVFVFYACGGGTSGVGAPPPPVDITITLEWDPPSTYTDGTQITDFVGYILYYGPSPGNYAHSVDVGNATTYTITLPPVTWYFSTKVYTAAGTMSGFSNEIGVTF